MVESEDPGTATVEELMDEVDSGNYVIPYFQRGFEWTPSDVSELFKSILQDYYAGLLLFWQLDNNRAEQQEWDPVWGAQVADRPDKAVLDGQQRLSSLYYAIYNPEKTFPTRKSHHIFTVNLINVLNEDYDDAVDNDWGSHKSWEELRADRDRWIETGKVPLSVLSAPAPENPDKEYINSEEFKEWTERFYEQREADLPDDVQPWDIRDVFIEVLNYSFVTFPLSSDRSMPDICNIFAKVNDTGMNLSTFDLMNAFLFPSGVKLRKDLWDEIKDDRLAEIDSNMDENLLKIISLRKQNYCSSKYLYNLIPGEETTREEPDGTRYQEVLVESGNEFEQLWKSAVEYAKQARKRLMNTGNAEFGAIKDDYIPYNTVLPVVAAILWQYDTAEGTAIDDREFNTTLQQWYWSAVFSQDYSGSSDTMMGRDYRDWKQWLSGSGTLEHLGKVDADFIREMDLAGEEGGSGRYNGVICLLALNGARDFYTGAILGTGDFSDQSIDDHHIFPKKVDDLPPEHSQEFGQFKDSILNRTLIFDKTNQKIQNQKPSQYCVKMESRHGGESEVRNLLQDHFISDKAYTHLKNDNFDRFIREREKEIKRQLIERVNNP